MSHGQATRSIFGRARVTQTVRPCLSALRHMVGPHQQAFACNPGLEAAFEIFGARAGVAQPGGDALAQFLSALADDDDGPAGIFVGPGGDGAMIAPNACRQHARVGGVVIVDAHIDDHRRIGRSDQAVELGNIDGIGRGHGVPSSLGGAETRYFGRSLTGRSRSTPGRKNDQNRRPSQRRSLALPLLCC